MRKLLAVLVPLTISSCLLFGAEEKASEKIVFETKNGNVTFLHQKHSEQDKEKCKACHDKLWPQKKGVALGYKAGVHKVAETKGTSCGACHKPKGVAFESKGNCVKCHAKKTAAPKKAD
jgi:c(7)-type cytochrome triheme protein